MEGGNPVEIEVYTVKQKLFSQNFLVDPIQMAEYNRPQTTQIITIELHQPIKRLDP